MAKCVLTYECCCADITQDRWNKLMRKTKPCNYKKMVAKIKRDCPDMYDSIGLKYPNPYKDQCRITPTHYVLVHSAIEYFFKKNPA